MKGGQDTRDWKREDGNTDREKRQKSEPERSEVYIQMNVRENTFPLFFDGLGFRHGETLHGLVLLSGHVLLVGRRSSFAVGVRVDQHAAVEGVAVSAGRIAVAMID